MHDRQLIQAWLPDHVHMAWRGDDIIVLDTRDDSYSCLIGAVGHVQPADRADAVLAHPEILEELKQAGLVTLRSPSAARASCRTPTKTLSPCPRTRVPDAMAVALNAINGGLTFRGRSFAELIAPIPPRQVASPDSPDAAHHLRRQVSAFCTLLPWLPFQGQCLHRAFMLRRLLAGRGLHVDWVFGVRTWPFMAHCWLQADDILLADDLDRVLGFTPILVA